MLVWPRGERDLVSQVRPVCVGYVCHAVLPPASFGLRERLFSSCDEFGGVDIEGVSDRDEFV